MTPFDPLRAQREIVAGLADVHRVISARARAAEQRLAEAEADHNALVKIERFVFSLMEDANTVLRLAQAEAEAQGKMGSPP